jgi:hypothetical protein
MYGAGRFSARKRYLPGVHARFNPETYQGLALARAYHCDYIRFAP